MTATVLAAQLYTLRDFLKTPAEVASALKKVRQIGYQAVQVSGLGPIEPERLGEAADQAGVRIVATHIAFDRIRSQVEQVIAEHQLWGCRHVAIGGLPAEYRSEDGYHRFAREASDAARPLVAAGLTFSYHNHSFELERFGGRTALEILYTESDPAVFSAEIDTYWIQHGGGNPVAWLQSLKGRCHVVHLKDMAMKGSQQLFAEVGEGNLDWPNILGACREAGVEWYIVEQDTCQRDPFDSLGLSLRNLGRLGLV